MIFRLLRIKKSNLKRLFNYYFFSYIMRPIKNIHLSIPEDLLIDAQKYAAEHNTTLNVLIIELLKSRVSHCCKDVTDILDKYTDKWEIDTLNTPFQREDIHK